MSIATLQEALEVNNPEPGDPVDVLAKVGGFEIGVIAGVVLGGAMMRRVVVLDGFISGRRPSPACSSLSGCPCSSCFRACPAGLCRY